MKSFTFYQPTRLHFGNGTRNATGDIVKAFADRVLFVVDPGLKAAIPEMVQDVRESLTRAGVSLRGVRHGQAQSHSRRHSGRRPDRARSQRQWLPRHGRRQRHRHGQGHRRRGDPSGHGLGLSLLQEGADLGDAADRCHQHDVGHRHADLEGVGVHQCRRARQVGDVERQPVVPGGHRRSRADAEPAAEGDGGNRVRHLHPHLRILHQCRRPALCRPARA